MCGVSADSGCPRQVSNLHQDFLPFPQKLLQFLLCGVGLGSRALTTLKVLR